jgi:guanosine-3',5'-bis(diphosphate) 3'-pyrophosphohydrolase
MSSYYRPAVVPPQLAIILAAMTSEDAERVQQAFQFAAAAHALHTRDEGTPYIDHPVRVAGIVWSELGRREPDLVVAALTHDILEDCPEITADILEGVIGSRPLGWVIDVTKAPPADGDKARRDRDYLDRLPRLTVEARLLKLADRIDNVRSVVLSPDRAKALRYLTVTRENFLPLAAATDVTAERLLAAACQTLENWLAQPPAEAAP